MQRFQDMSPGEILLIAGVIALGFLVIWVLLVILIWMVLNRAGFYADFFMALESLSTAAALATVVGGATVALAQLVEAIDSRKREIATSNLNAYNTIFEQMMSDENIEARRWIYQHLPDDPEQGLAGLSDEGRRYIKLVLNSFDRLGFMIQQDWISSDAIVRWVSPFVTKTWEKLGPYVEYEAQRRNEPDYYEAAKYLAERCIAWRRQNVPEAEVRWISDAL